MHFCKIPKMTTLEEEFSIDISLHVMCWYCEELTNFLNYLQTFYKFRKKIKLSITTFGKKKIIHLSFASFWTIYQHNNYVWSFFSAINKYDSMCYKKMLINESSILLTDSWKVMLSSNQYWFHCIFNSSIT